MRRDDLRYCVGFFTAFLLPACSSTVTARRPLSDNVLTEINETVNDRSGTVTLRGPASWPVPFVEGMSVGPESTEWSEAQPPGTVVRKRVPTEALHEIRIVKRGRGAAEGLGLGILFGAITGAVVGLTAGEHWCFERSPCQPFPMAVGAVGGALAGVLIGPVIGAAIGHRLTIDFENPLQGEE